MPWRRWQGKFSTLVFCLYAFAGLAFAQENVALKCGVEHQTGSTTNETWHCTGVAIDLAEWDFREHRYVLMVWHTAQHEGTLFVEIDGKQIPAQVVAVDKEADVAIVATASELPRVSRLAVHPRLVVQGYRTGEYEERPTVVVESKAAVESKDGDSGSVVLNEFGDIEGLLIGYIAGSHQAYIASVDTIRALCAKIPRARLPDPALPIARKECAPIIETESKAEVVEFVPPAEVRSQKSEVRSQKSEVRTERH